MLNAYVLFGSNNIPAAKKFYDALYAVFGVAPGEFMDDGNRVAYQTDGISVMIGKPSNGCPATYGNGTMFGFSCKSQEQLDAWHAAGLANGGTSCEDPPGVRDLKYGKIYLGYLRDPDGNKLGASFFLG